MQTYELKTQPDPKPIKDVLQQNFQKLLHRAELFAEIKQKLPTCLPPELAHLTEVCNIQASQLTLAVPNSALATLLRYQQKNILTHIQSWFPHCNIHSILTKVKAT